MSMKPKQAIKHLQFIVDNQKSVSTSRLKDLVTVIASHHKMLDRDNHLLRKRVARQRRTLRRLEESRR